MVVRALYHLVLACVFWFAIYYDLFELRVPDVLKIRHEKSAGRWKYLTFWNVISQGIFFSLSFINDVSKGFCTASKQHKAPACHLNGFLDAMFASVGFPIALFIGSLFWTIWWIDRELVFPSILDSFFPMWLNHIMHTLIIPAVGLEMLFIFHQYPSRRRSLAVLSFFTVVYLLWTFFVAYWWQFWTYPILEVLNVGQRSAFIVVCVLFTWVFYFIGELVNRATWGSSKATAATAEIQAGQRKKKRKAN